MLYNRIKRISPGTVAETSSFNATSNEHANKITAIDAAAGLTVTLPPASGSGNVYRMFIKTTVTSNTVIMQAPDAATTFAGNAVALQDAADTTVAFETAATTDTVTLNGATQGGLKGHLVTFTDVAADVYLVESIGAATGTEVTPFSAAV